MYCRGLDVHLDFRRDFRPKVKPYSGKLYCLRDFAPFSSQMKVTTRRSLFLLTVLAVAAVFLVAAEDGEALAEKVAEAAEAQEYREDAPQEVTSEIIKEAPPAVLNAGTGDVSTTGNCSADIDTFCADITPGAGRIAECLTGQIKASKKAGVGTPTVRQEL